MKRKPNSTTTTPSRWNILLLIIFCGVVLFVLHELFVSGDFTSIVSSSSSLSSSSSSSTRKGRYAEESSSSMTALEKVLALAKNKHEGNGDDDVDSKSKSNKINSQEKLKQAFERAEAVADQIPRRAASLDDESIREVMGTFKKKRNLIRSYARFLGVDATAPDIRYFQNITLKSCLKLCDMTPKCNYVVRNMTMYNNYFSNQINVQQKQQSVVEGPDRNGPTQCWLKSSFSLNTIPNINRETWVVSRNLMPRIAIGVLSAPHLLRTRLVACYHTWLHNEDTIVLLENTTESKNLVSLYFGHRAVKSQPIHNRYAGSARVLFLFDHPGDNESAPGAWKNLLLIKYMPAQYRRLSASPADWYFIVDDDSFVIMPNLRFILSLADSLDPWYTGLLMAAKDYTSGAPFIQGGAGIVMSQETLRRLDKKIDCCLELCRQNYGDFRTGCCVVHAAKVMPTLHRGFYSYSAWENAGTEMRKKYGYPMFPVSFHRFRHTKMIYEFQKHIDSFREANKMVRSSRYMMAPSDSRYIHFREKMEKLPPTERTWTFVDELVSQKMMMSLQHWNRTEETTGTFAPKFSP